MTEQESFATSDKSATHAQKNSDHNLNLLALADCKSEAGKEANACSNGSSIQRSNPMRSEKPGEPEDNPQHLPKLEIVTGAPVPKLAPGDYYEKLDSQHQTREFELHVPKNYDGKSPLPVVYMLHGFTENMNMMREYSQMNKLADEKGFAVAYLQAEKQPVPVTLPVVPIPVPSLLNPIPNERSWNFDKGTLTPKDPRYDDLAYIQRVKSIVESETNIDKKREYLAGFSEGGQASSYIAQEMPNTFAGVASVHGTMIDGDPRPKKTDATPFISVLGDDDKILPINGGSAFFHLPLEMARTSKPLDQAKAWAAADGATTQNSEYKSNTLTTHYTGGDKPVEQIVRLRHNSPEGERGGSHAWDGGNNGYAGEPNPDWIQRKSRADRQSDPDFDTSRTIVDFLLQNKLK